jgi:hypothetical protein
MEVPEKNESQWSKLIYLLQVFLVDHDQMLMMMTSDCFTRSFGTFFVSLVL